MIQADDYSDSIAAGTTFQIEFEPDDLDSITMAILEAVATFARQDILDLDPLETVIDTDALNDLFRPRSNGTSRTNLSIEFVYQDYLVFVESSGLVRIRPV